MARMIPDHGPCDSESEGERDLYTLLRAQLPNDYTVIHSLPWLCSAVRTLDPKAKPTGEIDFLIIHPKKGLLVLEVKSGEYRIEKNRFIHLHKNHIIDPIGQTRNNTHGIARWLGADPSLRLRIGYGFVFPDSDFTGRSPAPGMYDSSTTPAQPLYIDYRAMPDIAPRVIELMDYWKTTLRNTDLGENRAAKIVEFLTPTINGKPGWSSRILFNNKVWLQLTEEQSKVASRIIKTHNSLVTGWPGTGKTLIVIETARKLIAQQKKVLVVSFNAKLTEHIRTQLSGLKFCDVMTWHGLCGQASTALNRSENEKVDDWYRKQCERDLRDAIDEKLMNHYDALLVDEAQALTQSWCATLCNWFDNKTKAFFCDETQVFPYERGTISINELSKLLETEPFPLTIILRMPRAVTNLLEEVVPPKLQHSTPRALESDSVIEIITSTPCETVSSVRQDLINDGVSPEEILILTPSFLPPSFIEYLESERPRREVVAKFRGLEAPIILILGADWLETAELFSAYSRATSKCIAIYDSNSRHWAEAEAFRSRLKSFPENQALLQEEKNKLLISNIISLQTEKNSLKLKSINISWAKSWKAWLIEADDEKALSGMWIDYLAQYLSQPIYFWPEGSTSNLFLVKTESPTSTESYHRELLFFKFCETCNGLTPHMGVTQSNCNLCITAADKTLHLHTKKIKRLQLLDKIITGDLPNKRIRKLQPRLPLNIAAAAALFRAERNKIRSNALNAPLPVGRRIYLIAFAFVQARISTFAPGKTMQANALADEIYSRFKALNQISLMEWRKIFSNAMGTFYSKGYIQKINKGLYCPTEDDGVSTLRRQASGKGSD
ncbi:nuclease-related domain-containing DEAD/DEAH box helicase [Pseudomonas rhizoryzae]|uniref:nuclease-related domain-containing DEAD/DEAH box helicase n=1 Tax=Pseudomonas rhizoryzae TaxID=2571129 RepID=UPI0010C20231|nr:NERD domain-containing protein/DEAD/DEAH box helicase [Pseudomonas rhizoryzae]